MMTRDMVLCSTWSFVLVLVSFCSASPESGLREGAGRQDFTTREQHRVSIPQWARDARWYHIYIPRFHNGNRANDPPNTRSWTTTPWPPKNEAGKSANQPASKGSSLRLDGLSYGGDLQGVRARLDYLKNLGVNTLHLSSIFPGSSVYGGRTTDLRHVDPKLTQSDPGKNERTEHVNPKTWVFTAGDRVFLELLREAHGQDMRVVIDAAFTPIAGDSWMCEDARRRGKASPFVGWCDADGVKADERADAAKGGFVPKPLASSDEARKHLFDITRRWMDPNGDGDPSDGVDGWWLPSGENLSRTFWKKWRGQVKKINRDALVVGDGRGKYKGWNESGASDVTVDGPVSQAIRRFFRVNQSGYSLESFLADLTSIYNRTGLDRALATPIPLSILETGRALDSLMPSLPEGKYARDPHLKPTDAEVVAWRLATVVQHCVPGAPVTYNGDEFGMYGHGDRTRAPIAWPDLMPKSGAGYVISGAGDLAGLIQWLHLRRGLDPPLHAGGFRVVLSDAARRLFAFSRPISDGEVIVLINYGSAKQRVIVPTGKPGQLIGVLIPHLGPAPRRMPFRSKRPTQHSPLIRPLLANGSRQFANDRGEIKFWIGPQSARLILAYDHP